MVYAMSRGRRAYRRRNEPTVDGLPEQMHYADTGCEVSQSCLDCPLPRCKYDDPAWYHAYRREGRDRQLLDTYAAGGLSVFEVARRHNVSPRTVHRALQRSRRPIAASA